METKFLKIGFIGAGGVNFGGPEGPWDHATRLEQYCGPSNSDYNHNTVVVTAIVDPNVKQAATVLAARRENPQHSVMWANTKIYSSVQELLKEDKDVVPDAVFVGLPPLCHGSTLSPFDIEIQLANAGIHMLIEKPISCHPLEQVQHVQEVVSGSKSKDGKKLIVSVGYMLRYSTAVRKMHEILEQYGGQVVSTVARYNCAYTSILKSSWWDMKFSGGPIVEQATHFCDLSRHFGGDIDLESVQSVCVGAIEAKGKLSKIPVDESMIEESHRIPRTTSAIWRYKNGAIGSLNHALLMHGHRYTTEFEVWGDGVRMVLVDPYSNCKLIVRTPESDEDREVPLESEDMYAAELRAFIDAINNDEPSPVRSSYADACHTYALSVAIRDASKASMK